HVWCHFECPSGACSSLQLKNWHCVQNHQGKRWLHQGDSYIRHSYIKEHDWDKILNLLDLAGYGVAVAVSKEFKGSFRGLTYKSPLLDLMIKSGRNGKNNGKGYYFYEKGSKPKPDLSILPIVEESRRLANIMPGGKPIFITDQEIVEMILFPIVNEACRVLDEGMVIQASDLDIACVLGMSFPSYSVFSDVFDEKIFKNLKVGSRARKHFTSWSGVG
ncbi:peroxisomal fatty acid beta-oxidation multifunctional protein AIM1-like, partial [Arachis ipaensis]|uniref:peroxisomal fatty acid beta-oxidation multifunctional protein AIM1-like n=1 Tax=Arachis ipaensis TaxID=130454 RepID=UPI000A2B7B3A